MLVQRYRDAIAPVAPLHLVFVWLVQQQHTLVLLHLLYSNCSNSASFEAVVEGLTDSSSGLFKLVSTSRTFTARRRFFCKA